MNQLIDFINKISKNLKARFFLFFLFFSFIFAIVLYNILYQTYYRATQVQIETICDAYKSATRSSLASFINDIYSFTKILDNDQDLIPTLEECYNSKEPITPETTAKIEDILRRYVKTNSKISSLRLYVDNYAGYYQTKNFYATNSSSKVISEDYMGRTKWYNDAYDGSGKLIFRPTYKKMFSLPEILIDDSEYSYTENIMSFYKVIKSSYGKQLAVISVDIDESIFYNILQDISLPYDSKAYITYPDGTVISSTDRNLVGKNFYAEFPYITKSELNPFNRTFSPTILEEYMYRQETFYYEDWKIITVTPKSNLFINLSTFNNLITTFIVYFILIGFVISIIMTKIFANPINNLLTSINSVKGGDLSSRIEINPNTYNEVADVQESFNDMLDSLQTLFNENYEIRIKEKEAQIKSLEAQINPHFLYNTLDTINWKVYMLGGEDISKLITSLSQILRYSINSKFKTVTLNEEIEQLKNYLFIQETRYEGRIKVQLNILPETTSLMVYKLLIQPMVENAFVHGLENKEEGGLIKISSYIKDNNLIIEIFDNGDGISSEKIEPLLNPQEDTSSDFLSDTRTHIGINNVNSRLKFYYGEEYGVKIDSVVNKYTNITLVFPVVHSKEDLDEKDSYSR